ncbi:MAG: Ig-like domain-containing protein [Leptospira sp.]|nr:Ig-like domain-containing protein [Leptospira sp.]
MKSKVISILVCFILSLYSCSQILDNGEGPLDFIPAISVLQNSDIPKILLSSPVDGSIGIDPESPITVLFSLPMNITYCESGFSLSRDGIPVEGAFTWLGNLMSFKSYKPLSDAGLYTYALSKSRVESLQGVNLQDDFRVNFSFSSDLESPRVIKTIPANNAAGVIPEALITIQFNKPMDKFSVFNAVNLNPGIEFDIPNTIISPDQTTYQFKPSTLLNFGVSYQLTISENAIDLSGNPLAGPVNVSFTVGTDFTNPTLTEIFTSSVINFVNNEIFLNEGVNKNDSIFLNFSKPIKPLTISSAINISPNVSFTVNQISATNYEIQFSEPLSVYQIYNIEISSAILDLNNNPLVKSYNYNIKVNGDTSQKIKLRGIYSNNTFTNQLVTTNVNISTPPLTTCPALNIECDLDLYIHFCYGELPSDCLFPLIGNSQILLSSLKLEVTREFGTPIGAGIEFFENANNATPIALAPSTLAYSSILRNLDRSSTYIITVKGGQTGIRDNFGNTMDNDYSIRIRYP